MLINYLFKIGLKFNFGPLRPLFKIIASIFRYYYTIFTTKSKEKSIIFIAGLPKSGTTWLENILTLDGEFTSIMPPDITIWEQKFSRSNNYIPSHDIFSKLPKGKWVMKLHCKFSEELDLFLKNNNIKTIVIHRNLEKVLDSHLHYALKTKFHPDHNDLKKIIRKDEALTWLSQKYKREYSEWITSWKNQKNTYNLTYDDLLKDTNHEVTCILKFLEIDISKELITKIINKNSIDKLRSKSVHKEFYRGAQLKK
jgi:hypothetical protein